MKKIYIALIVIVLILPVIIITIIIGTSMITTINPKGQIERANTYNRNSAIKNIEFGLKMYDIDYKKYPQNLEELKTTNNIYSASSFVDPISKKPYLYSLTKNGQDYLLCVVDKSTEKICGDKTNLLSKKFPLTNNN